MWTFVYFINYRPLNKNIFKTGKLEQLNGRFEMKSIQQKPAFYNLNNYSNMFNYVLTAYFTLCFTLISKFIFVSFASVLVENRETGTDADDVSQPSFHLLQLTGLRNSRVKFPNR